MSVTKRGNRFQVKVVHRLLPKPYYLQFDDEVAARSASDKLMSMLAAGVIPVEMLAPKAAHDPLLLEIVRDYTKLAPVTDSDNLLLTTMLPELVVVCRRDLTYGWVEAYVRRLKLERNAAPSTIRKRIGLLGRIVHWHDTRTTADGAQLPANPFRLLPIGYSGYTRPEAAKLAAEGKLAKADVARKRRLMPGEEARIRAALAGAKREDRERAWPTDPDFVLLFEVILATGMRLLEAFRLRTAGIDLGRRLIHVEGSKGARGVIKPRTVPMGSALAAKLQAHMEEQPTAPKEGDGQLLFGFWSGRLADQKKCGAALSARFRTLFSYAQCEDLREHDLRHEATCRWVTMRAKDGGWMWSDAEVCKIMGWTDTRMMLRYASLRGEDLSSRMD